MRREFGRIKKGDTEPYVEKLKLMQESLFQIQQELDSKNSRRALDAVRFSLLIIDGYLRNVQYDYSRFKTDEGEAFLQALLFTFDPFRNDSIREKMEGEYQLDNRGELRRYFTPYILCLIYLEDTVIHWIGQLGREGYFLYLNEQLGVHLEEIQDDEVLEDGEDTSIFEGS